MGIINLRPLFFFAHTLSTGECGITSRERIETLLQLQGALVALEALEALEGEICYLSLFQPYLDFFPFQCANTNCGTALTVTLASMAHLCLNMHRTFGIKI